MLKLRHGVNLACVISLAAMIGCQAQGPASTGTDESTLNRAGGTRTGAPAANGAAGTALGTGDGATSPNAAGQGGSIGSGLTNGSGAGAGAGAAGGGNATAGGTTAGGGAIPKASVDNTPSREEVLAAVPAMSVGAKTGGLYKSPDGRLQAVIPPGALSTDTEVKFAPVDTAGLPANPIMTPGIMFAMDLGGAALKDGVAIIVKSKVDPRFVEEFQKSAPGKDPASVGLSQEDGVWYLAMPVKGISGPDAQRLQANRVDGDLATVEMQPPPAVYGLKAMAQDQLNNDGGGGSGGSGASTAPSPSTSPTTAPSPTAPPTPTPEPKLQTSLSDDPIANSWPAMTQSEKNDPKHAPVENMTIKAQGHDVTFPIRATREASLSAANRPEYVHCFIGHGWCEGETVYAAIDGAITFNKGVTTNHLPPADLTAVVNQRRAAWDCGVAETVNVTAKCVYESDDTINNVDGAPATDATLRTLAGGAEMSRSAAPTGTLTFPVGLGRTFKLYGSIDVPEYKESAKKDIVAANGMPEIVIKIPKYSPLITVNFTADAPLPASYDVTVKYKIDGGEEKSFTGPATSSQQFVSFRAIVPNDQDHTLTLTKVSTENFADDRSGDMLQARGGVHRNREYTFSVNMKAIAGK